MVLASPLVLGFRGLGLGIGGLLGRLAGWRWWWSRWRGCCQSRAARESQLGGGGGGGIDFQLVSIGGGAAGAEGSGGETATRARE